MSSAVKYGLPKMYKKRLSSITYNSCIWQHGTKITTQQLSESKHKSG